MGASQASRDSLPTMASLRAVAEASRKGQLLRCMLLGECTLATQAWRCQPQRWRVPMPRTRPAAVAAVKVVRARVRGPHQRRLPIARAESGAKQKRRKEIEIRRREKKSRNLRHAEKREENGKGKTRTEEGTDIEIKKKEARRLKKAKTKKNELSEEK